MDLDIVDVIFPKSNTEYEAVNQGDSVTLVWVLKNNGTDTLLPTDSIKIMTGAWFIAGLQANSVVTISATQRTIAPGAYDTLTYGFRSGETRIQTYTLTVPNGTTIANAPHIIYGQRGTDIFESDSIVFNGNNLEGAAESNRTASTNFSFKGLSINELKNIALNVYPNPAQSTLNFTHNFNKATAATLKVIDLMGRTVNVEQYEVNTGSKNFTLDISNLANGSYFVELTTAEDRGVTKFTVSK